MEMARKPQPNETKEATEKVASADPKTPAGKPKVTDHGNGIVSIDN